MRLFEIVTPQLYLSTSHQQPVGETIERHQTTFPLGSVLEGKLEAVRPDDCLPRATSLFLAIEPHDAEFVYLVEPIGEIERLHTGWLAMLKAANPNSVGEVDLATRGYWSGKITPDAQGEPWEHRVGKARIVRRVGGYGLETSSSANPEVHLV